MSIEERQWSHFSFKRASETGLLGRVTAGGEMDVSGMMAIVSRDVRIVFPTQIATALPQK